MPFYPAWPGHRIAYDDDGSQLLRVPFSSATSDFSSNAVELNDEDVTGYQAGAGFNSYLVWIWPELRDMDGYYVNSVTGGGGGTYYPGGWSMSNLQYSTDTTNGRDGTWNTWVTADNYQNNSTAADAHLLFIGSASVAGTRGVRFSYSTDSFDNARLYRCHWYGEIAAGETPDRILYVDDTSGLQFTLDLDYGDVPRGAARDDLMKLKNNSSTLTANTVQLTAETLYGSITNWYTFSDGGAFSGTLSITSIANTASSNTVTVRRVIPTGQTLGTQMARMQLSVASWT